MRSNKIHYLTRFKWQLFRLLELFSDLRGNSTGGRFEVDHPSSPTPSLWVFVSTIGELNAIAPFLRRLVSETPSLKLVLITDHPHYRESYLENYPQAAICATRGHSRDAEILAELYPPRILLVGEIPCLPSDAPCRFSFAFLMHAKRMGAASFLVNGWLYHYPPPSRMDAIERLLFKSDYLRLFDAIGVQTKEIGEHLVTHGANEDCLSIVGNIKFDAMQRIDWSPLQTRSPIMLSALLSSGRPIIVAGCVTDQSEQELVFNAFARLRSTHTTALLVIAPRHPEVKEVIQSINDGLRKNNFEAERRSAINDTPIDIRTDCLVLDTIGELKDFYAAATVAHVGVDHNVLEPLAFGKPVTVKPGWESTYPSFPVYSMMISAAALLETDSPEGLASAWSELLSNDMFYKEKTESIDKILRSAQGACDKNFKLLENWIRKI